MERVKDLYRLHSISNMGLWESQITSTVLVEALWKVQHSTYVSTILTSNFSKQYQYVRNVHNYSKIGLWLFWLLHWRKFEVWGSNSTFISFTQIHIEINTTKPNFTVNVGLTQKLITLPGNFLVWSGREFVYELIHYLVDHFLI